MLFKLQPVMDVLNWVQPQVLFVRLHDTRERAYRERVVTDEMDRFVRAREKPSDHAPTWITLRD